MTTAQIVQKIRSQFADAIQETTEGLLFGIAKDGTFQRDAVELAIREAFIDGVIAAWLRDKDGGHTRYFRND